jgi:hypothetical protein
MEYEAPPWRRFNALSKASPLTFSRRKHIKAILTDSQELLTKQKFRSYNDMQISTSYSWCRVLEN